MTYKLAQMVSPERRDHGMYWERGLNLVWGCTKVSDGCRGCWAEALAARYRDSPAMKDKLDGLLDKDGHWTGEIHLDWQAIDKPLHVKKPSMWSIWNDLYHEGVDERFLVKVFKMMEKAHWHFFLILTKRPENAFSLISKGMKPLPNVGIGVTAENQEQWDLRVPRLQHVSAALKFISCEPALQLLDFGGCELSDIGWIIAGGETGPSSRPSHPAWHRKLKDACEFYGIPFYFKGFGAWKPDPRMFDTHIKWVNKASTWVNGGTCVDFNGKVLKIGKDFMDCSYPVAIMHRTNHPKDNRLLDGQTYNEMPEV